MEIKRGREWSILTLEDRIRSRDLSSMSLLPKPLDHYKTDGTNLDVLNK